MSIIMQVGIIFGLCFIGNVVASIMPIPIPGSIIGMGLMLILLGTKFLKVKQVEDVSGFLLRNMAFFFIPAGVSIMESFSVIKDKIGVLLLICVLTTIITFGVTGLTAKAIIKYQEKPRRRKDV